MNVSLGLARGVGTLGRSEGPTGYGSRCRLAAGWAASRSGPYTGRSAGTRLRREGVCPQHPEDGAKAAPVFLLRVVLIAAVLKRQQRLDCREVCV